MARTASTTSRTYGKEKTTDSWPWRSRRSSTWWTGSASRTPLRLVGGSYAARLMGLRRYRELVAIAGVPPLLFAAFLGRLPFGMNILAVILLLRKAGFDYAQVGVVTAASGLSVGVSAPVLGRLVDRVGQTRVLVIAAALTVVSGTAFVLAVLAGAGIALATALAFVLGLCVPPVSASLRALLPDVVGRDRL